MPGGLPLGVLGPGADDLLLGDGLPARAPVLLRAGHRSPVCCDVLDSDAGCAVALKGVVPGAAVDLPLGALVDDLNRVGVVGVRAVVRGECEDRALGLGL